MDILYIPERSLSHEVTPAKGTRFWACVLTFLRFFTALLLTQSISLVDVKDREL